MCSLTYIEHFLILDSTITASVLTSAFASLFAIPIGITSSAIGWKSWAIPAGFNREFYNRSKKFFFHNNNVEMYSAHNEGKPAFAEQFIRTLKHKIYIHMTSVSKNLYADKLEDIVDKYSNTYHRTIKVKPVDVKSNTDINSNTEINDKDPKFKIGDIIRIPKYKNIFAKGYVPNRSEEAFVITKDKNTVPWTYVLSNRNGEEIVGMF